MRSGAYIGQALSNKQLLSNNFDSMNACSCLLKRALQSKSGWVVPDCKELRWEFEASKQRAAADNAGFSCSTAQPPLPQQLQATQPHDPHEPSHALGTELRKTRLLPQPRGPWAAVSPARQREPPSVAIERINERIEQVAQQPPEPEPHQSPEAPELESHALPPPPTPPPSPLPPPPPPPSALPNAQYYIDRNEPIPSYIFEENHARHFGKRIEQAAQQRINERNEQAAQQPPEPQPHESPEPPESEPHSLRPPPPPPPPPPVLSNAHYYIDRNEPMRSRNLEGDHAWHFGSNPRPPPSGPEPSDCDKRPVTVTGAEPTQPSARDTQPVTEPTDALLMRPYTPPRKVAAPKTRPSSQSWPSGQQVVASAARQREPTSDDIQQAVRQRINDHIEHGAQQRLLERAEKALQQADACVATHGRLRNGDIRQLGLREVIHDLKVYIQAARRPIGARATRPSTTVKAVPKPWKLKLRVHRQRGGKRGKFKQRKTSDWRQSGLSQGRSRSGWSSWGQELG